MTVAEVLCKVLRNNLCVLIREQHELGTAPVFWKEPAAAQAVAV